MLLSVHLDVFALAKITCLLGPSHSSADANLNLVGYGFDVKAKSPDHLLVKKAFPGKITALFRHSATVWTGHAPLGWFKEEKDLLWNYNRVKKKLTSTTASNVRP